MGLPHDTRDELKDALFVQGFSTRPAATEVSGRGLGMSAVWRAVQDMGGEVDVTSEHGRGTLVSFFVPAERHDSFVRSLLHPRGYLSSPPRD